MLRPTLEKTEKSAASGLFARLGASFSGAKFGLATGLASDLVLQTGGLSTALSGMRTVAESALQNRQTGAQKIWTSLVKHHQRAGNQIMYAKSTGGEPKRGWGIPPQPAPAVYVSSGSLLWEHEPLDGKTFDVDFTAGVDVYSKCGCGSGRKIRFCCDGLQNYRPKFMQNTARMGSI